MFLQRQCAMKIHNAEMLDVVSLHKFYTSLDITRNLKQEYDRSTREREQECNFPSFIFIFFSLSSSLNRNFLPAMRRNRFVFFFILLFSFSESTNKIIQILMILKIYIRNDRTTDSIVSAAMNTKKKHIECICC